MLAFVKADGEPGVLVLELPFPGDGFDPESFLLFFLGAVGRGGPAPTVNVVGGLVAG